MSGIGSLFGMIEDTPDARDKPFHLAVLVDHVKGEIDLTAGMPPVVNQGPVGTCTCQAAVAMVENLYPGVRPSVLQLYWDARVAGGYPTNVDGGSQIRDAMKVLQKQGVMPEDIWPYVPDNFNDSPPTTYEGERTTIANYSRINTVEDGLKCLTLLHPFVLSIDLPDYFNSHAGDIGVLPKPMDKVGHLGLHAMLAVGHDTNFKGSAVYQQAIDAGMDPNSFDDTAFLVRNSWGTWWGLKDGDPAHQGHFWLPESWISNRSLVGDCWTGFKLITTADAPEGPTVGGVPIQGRSV